MKRNCFELCREIGLEIGLVSDPTITSFTDTLLQARLLQLLNRAKSWVCSNVDLDILKDTVTIGTTAAYTTGTVSVTQNTTTITGAGTTFTAAMEGRKIQIGSSSAYYTIVKYASGTSLQIDRPYVEASVTGGTYKIYQDLYEMPPYVHTIIDIRVADYQNPMNRKTVDWIQTRFSDPFESTGEPLYWAIKSYKTTRLPATSGTYAATASTSTTTIYDTTNLSNTVQDLYRGWLVYNVTRSKVAEVVSSDMTTRTISLDRVIASQVATDTYWLMKRELQVVMRPTPITAMPLIVTYKKRPTMFRADTDYENEIADTYEDILIFKAVADYYAASDPTRQAAFDGKAVEMLGLLRTENESMAVTTMVLGSNPADDRDFAWGDKYYRRSE